MVVAGAPAVGLVVEAGHQITAGDGAPDLPVIDDWLTIGVLAIGVAQIVVSRPPGPTPDRRRRAPPATRGHHVA